MHHHVSASEVSIQVARSCSLSRGVLVLPARGALAHDEHRQRRVREQVAVTLPQGVARPWRSCADDDQARAVLVRDLDDASSRRCLGARDGRAEAGLLGQRSSVRRRCFSGVPNATASSASKCWPRPGRSRRPPAATRTRSAPRGRPQLPAGLLDRLRGELGAVIAREPAGARHVYPWSLGALIPSAAVCGTPRALQTAAVSTMPARRRREAIGSASAVAPRHHVRATPSTAPAIAEADESAIPVEPT